jgi:alkylation response protein AidB-like acyl-CoA dehydrogenase
MMRLLQAARSIDMSDAFDREYPTLAALRRANAWQVNQCEQVWRLFHDFATEVVEPVALELDRSGWSAPAQSLDSILVEACKRRIFSMTLPRSAGGQGVTMLAFTVGLERLATSCLGIANLLAVHGLALGVMGAVGALSHLRQVAARIIEGERMAKPYLLSTAATEPSAGSDMEDADLLTHAILECEARSVADGWELNGTKIFVSNGSLASGYVVLMPTNRASAVESLSAFFVERGRAGLELRRVERKLGQRACPSAEIRFERCVVPGSHKLNQHTVAGKALDLVLGASRGTVAAFGAGAAFGVLHDCVKLCQVTEPSLGPLLASESAQSILSQMWQNARLARCSYLDATLGNGAFGLVSLMEVAALRQLDRVVPPGIGAWFSSRSLMDSPFLNREVRRWLDLLSSRNVAAASAHASAAKIASSRLALQNCALAAELLGSWATLESSGLPKRWRDSRVLAIYEGTNEVNALDVYKKAVREEVARKDV